MSAKVEIRFEFKTVKCINCGVPFGLADYHQQALRNSHNNFYCPNGHPQCYMSESTEERLQRELKEEQERTVQIRQRAEFYRRSSEEKDRVITGLQTKVKKVETRIAHDICPCCNRQFKQVVAHIKRKHPEFKA